jgi:uncharacterized protein (TIGR02678 family)
MMIEDNENIKEAIFILMEKFIILSQDHPDEFRYIKNYEKSIRRFLMDNFGYRLILETEIAKVEKIPYRSEDWMGIKEFRTPMDYMFFTSILAFLENRNADDLFLIRTAAEEVKGFLSDITIVEWKDRKTRESFVRALQFAERNHLIDYKDGDLDQFEKDEQADVLYGSTYLSKYFLRSFTQPLSEFDSVEDVHQDGLDRENVRHTLFRRLYFEPVVYREELTPDEQKYLDHRTRRDSIINEIETYTIYKVERYPNEWLLIHEEKKHNLLQHPSTKGESEIVLHLASVIKKQVLALDEELNGPFTITYGMYEDFVKQTINRYSPGWWKKFREEMTMSEVARTMLNYMVDWKLASFDREIYEVKIYPALVRMTGSYPSDFEEYMNSPETEVTT